MLFNLSEISQRISSEDRETRLIPSRINPIFLAGKIARGVVSEDISEAQGL